MTKTLAVAALLTLAGSVWAAPERIAIVMPQASFGTLSGQVNLGPGTTSIEESAGRVLGRFVREMSKKDAWRSYDLVPFGEARAAGTAERALLTADASAADRVRFAQAVAKRLDARYVVTGEVRELTSYRAASFPLARRGGRATVALLVYDAREERYVYSDTRTETSLRAQITQADSLVVVQDQALLNAYQRALEPFVRGERKEVATAATKLIGTVKSVTAGGKALLDLGSASGVRAGDVFTSLDGGVRLKVVEVFENGALAEVLEGTPTKDMAVRTGG